MLQKFASVELKHLWIQGRFKKIIIIKASYFLKRLLGKKTRLTKYGSLMYIYERTKTTFAEEIRFFYDKQVDPVKV